MYCEIFTGIEGICTWGLGVPLLERCAGVSVRWGLYWRATGEGRLYCWGRVSVQRGLKWEASVGMLGGSVCTEGCAGGSVCAEWSVLWVQSFLGAFGLYCKVCAGRVCMC